jgi:hypothetical protein
MEPAEWEAWVELASPMVRRKPCYDCLPAFARQMRAEGRCESEPEQEPPRHSGGGRTSTPESVARREEARRLFHEQHWSYGMIAKHFAVHHSTAWNMVNRRVRRTAA